MFLLVTLPESWETFRTTLNNSSPATGLTSANVGGNLLTEEVNRKNFEPAKGGNALVVRGKSNANGKHADKKSHSESRGLDKKDIECYFCHKKGHVRRKTIPSGNLRRARTRKRAKVPKALMKSLRRLMQHVVMRMGISSSCL